MHPVLIKIVPLVIRWYGVMIAIACLLGIWVAGREAERKGIDREKIQDIFLYAIIGAIIGARLYYVAFADWASDRPDRVFSQRRCPWISQRHAMGMVYPAREYYEYDSNQEEHLSRYRVKAS